MRNRLSEFLIYTNSVLYIDTLIEEHNKAFHADFLQILRNFENLATPHKCWAVMWLNKFKDSMLRFTVIIYLLTFLLSCDSDSELQETMQESVDSIAIQLNDSAMKRYQDYVFGRDESITNLEVAIEELSQAIEIEPEVANFYSNRSQLLLLLGKNDEAIEELKKILTFKPDFAEGIESIGYIHEINGNYSEAQKWYQKAIDAYEQRIKEDRYVINSKLAIVHLLFFTENVESALQTYNELKQEYPESEEIQFAEPFFEEFDREKFLTDFQGM